MKTAKSLLEDIKIEDELPSEAGTYFRTVMGFTNGERNTILADRELKIVADWINYYLEMPKHQKNKLLDELTKEDV